MKKDYEDIPGTFVFDADRSREGYHLNQFCITLRLQKNRDAFNANEEAYLDGFPMTPEQREAVLKREWNRLLELGGNVYYTSKLAANDGINFQNLAGLMTGMGVESYREMMLNGGRSIDGNRYKSEWGEE
ncbi:protocatechuate 4,5-dioxygenase subunit alpha [Pararhodobacter zhoushanensis]|uniref:Protocatechuate 4,5-dioxygenase subunit alpha n=1 Tax=Pararhodobacter zhoushanensis TaxID=2479545 RepID=A0ABT3GWX7_9RHOB|nr:protocatechuate 4,5-dioxygenase subunit alpha [Pararhodobacter zhoushanensis]MCW1932048.1 protocatechuate 4,5-dioxygenase subunit alpha [Pararhodobacter zhoushanensis]